MNRPHSISEAKGIGLDLLAEAFSCQPHVRVATLGPEGTSSAAAARLISESVGTNAHVHLFQSYEDAATAVVEKEADCIVVANAYSLINRFYISDDLVAAAAFPMATPPYGVAIRQCQDSPLCRFIATHPAPQHLIGRWFDKHCQARMNIVNATSTSAAARMVRNGEVDACVTTDTARQINGLAFISPLFTIQMLWSIFVRKDHPGSITLFGKPHEEMCIRN
jgi:prephenate dehydratase